MAPGSNDGGRLEDKTDCTSDVDAALSQSSALLSSGALDDAISLLMGAEKKCRLGNDGPNLVRVVNGITSAVLNAEDGVSWPALRRSIEAVCSRRSQKTAAVAAAVTAGAGALAQHDAGEPRYAAPPSEVEATTRLLRDLTDGRIYLEKERAELTLRLARILEGAGDAEGAADAMQDVHVETYGSIPKRGKIDFILEQMRLTLLKGDFVRAAIVANKVNKKALAEKGMARQRIAYYDLMAQYHRHEKDAFSLSNDYHQMYLTRSPPKTETEEEEKKMDLEDGDEKEKEEADANDAVQNEEKALEALKSTVMFLVLSPFSKDQQDMLHRIAKHDEKQLQKILPFK
mmetsp:Transcript_34304/g.79322  ORF Transcript_34304/g.79322 Transcript_34304/m.79322 type:complete len:344 (-) Transcript_34304:659-1690(-)